MKGEMRMRMRMEYENVSSKEMKSGNVASNGSEEGGGKVCVCERVREKKEDRLHFWE